MNNDNNKFSFTYSAPTEAERREIETIRRQYKPDDGNDNKIDRLRKLHSLVVGRATAVSLAVGIVGTLIMGGGMALVLEFSEMVLGIIIAATGVLPIAAAYPIYKYIVRLGKRKHGDDILRLSDEILGDEK